MQDTPSPIILVEDLDIVREGLRALLEPHKEYSIVGEARTAQEAIQKTSSLKPEIILMDLHLQPSMDGADAAKEIKRLHPKTKVIVLTADNKDRMLYKALSAGVDGYLHKTSSTEELVQAMDTVRSGKPYICPDAASRLIEGYLRTGGSELTSPLESLTQREEQVLSLTSKGLGNKAIAEKLCISHKTVEKHKANLKRKLNLKSTAELISFSFDNDLT